MEPAGWITLAAVIVALSLGLSSLIQTHKLQKRERKERLLNEIIKWAEDTINVSFGTTVTIDPALERRVHLLLSTGNTILQYQAIDTRSKYITDIAIVFGKELHDEVVAFISTINSVRSTLNKFFKKVEDEDLKKEKTEYELELQRRATKLIQLATKIKTEL
jgi:hypothetical protein